MDFYCEEFIGSKTCSLIRHFLHKHTGMLRCAASTQRCSITKMTHCKRRCGVRRFTLPVQAGLHATDTSQRVLIHLWSTWTSRLHVSDSRRFKNIKRTITGADEAADDEMNCDQSADQLLVHNMSENGGKGQSFLKCFQRCSVLTVGTFDCVIK